MIAFSPSFNPPNPKETPKDGAVFPSLEPTAKLGWILIRHRWISAAQLQTILTQQNHASKKLGELLLEQSLISEGQLSEALQEQYWRRNGYWVIG
jgi:hypothetical protein